MGHSMFHRVRRALGNATHFGYNGRMNVTQILIPCVGYAVAAGLAVFRLFERKKLDGELGACLIVLVRRKKKLLVPALVLCAALITLVLLRPFEPWVSMMLVATAVLGVDLLVRDTVLQARNGVYESALITGGRLLRKDEVSAFPTLAYENDSEEASTVPPNMLKTVTKTKGIVFLEFADEEERNRAVSVVKDWV